MRILILNWKDLAHPLAGGAEVFTHEVAEGLVDRGHEVTIFASSVANRPVHETMGGVEVIRGGGRLTVYRSARRYWKKQSSGRFDVVIDEINTRPFMTPHWIGDTPIVALIYQLAREIWSYETPFPVSVLGRYVLEPWWLRAYRNVPTLTISESSAASLRAHHGWRDVTVVPVGLDALTPPLVRKEERPTVVFLARLVAMKRPKDAIRGFQHLRSVRRDARLWLIGTGREHERIRVMALEGVELLGRVSSEERFERLARAHVLVATSVREGWGLNVSEAAFAGTPTIAYGVPGLVDSVPASGGALVDSTPEALGDALVRFFAGELPLAPRVSTQTWPEVADAVEQRLRAAITAARDDPGGGRGRRA